MTATAICWKSLFAEADRFSKSLFFVSLKKHRQDTLSKSSITGLDAAVLYALVYLCKPEVIVESGTYRGMSTAIMRQAQVDTGIKNGLVATVDNHPRRNIGLLIPEELRGGVCQIKGDIAQACDFGEMPSRINMFFHDSSHTQFHQRWEYKTFWPRIQPGGLLVSHDVNMSSAFSQFVTDSYAHDDNGYAIVDQTAHREWGRVGKIGFIQKT